MPHSSSMIKRNYYFITIVIVRMGEILCSAIIYLSAMLLVCSLGSADDVPGCPASCQCAHPAGIDSLDIACPARTEGQNLEKEINALLSITERLSRLNITNTQLAWIPKVVCDLTDLTQLNMDNNQLNALPDNCLSRLSALRVFSARNNRITRLQDGLISGLVNLEQLILDDNKIASIGLRVLSNPSDLPRLKVIDLSNNLLTSLEPWPMIRAQASPGFSAILSNNRISTFTNAANWTYKCRDAFIEMNLNLKANNISYYSSLVDEYFNTVIDLHCFSRGIRLHLSVIEVDVISPYQCDCLDFLIFTTSLMFPFGSGYLESVFCRNVVPNVRANAFKPEDAICDVTTQCPGGCRCIYQPSNSTFHVLCAKLPQNIPNNELPQNIPPANLPKHNLLMPTKLPMYKLDFSGNKIKLLEARYYFNNTKILDVSNAQLENVTEEALEAMQHIRMIYLHDNLITTLPHAITTMNFSFSSLSLYNNPFDCNCDQLWLKDWLTTVRDRLTNSDGIHCNTPARLNGKVIWSVNETDFCYKDHLDPRVLASALSASLVPILVIAFFLVLFRFRVQSYKMFRFHPFDRDECAGEEMTYDVFISNSHEDKELARELLEFLEDNGCKVCFHQRDFMPGEPIYQNIVEAVYTSKRVLCLVTPYFLKSKYCLDEFSIAQSHNAEKKRRRLVIMKHEEFDIDAMIDTELNEGDQLNEDDHINCNTQLLAAGSEESSGKQSSASVLGDFVKRHTYINLSADSWKDQLLYAMPINRLGLPPDDQN